MIHRREIPLNNHYFIAISLISVFFLYSSIPTCAKEVVVKKDFIVGLSMSPGYWIVDMESDLKMIKEIANTVFVAAGRYKNFQEKKLKPTLDAVQRYSLKAILQYYRIADGNTTLQDLASTYGNHPAVIGFKIKDELGENGESDDYWLQRLSEARKIIRQYSDKPIMFDIIPWEFWNTGNTSYERRFPASKNKAIDRYVDSGLIDWLIISVGEKIPEVLPKAMERWGSKVKILIRTGANFKGDVYENLSLSSDPIKVRQRAIDAHKNGAIGVHYYTWQHRDHRILNKDGTSTPLYEEMLRTYRQFKNE